MHQSSTQKRQPTNQHSITISGTAQSGSEVTLSRDEDTFISVTTVDSNGGWSIENISLIENANTFTATATDVGGTSGNSNSVIIRLDTTVPIPPVINTEAITTNQHSITISGTAQLGSEVTLSRDEDTFISVTTVNSNGGWSIENIVLIENANTFTATATDVGGTSGNSNSVIIRLDTSSPDAPVINTEATTTNQHSITISGTAQSGSEVTLSRDEDTFISVTTVDSNGGWSIENIVLIENANTFTATATDVGGTSGNSNSVIIRLDTTVPIPPVINTEAISTNQNSITISGTAQLGSEVTLSRDEDTFISVTTVDSNGGWSIENIVLIENANTFTATATDVGGTSGNSNSVIIRLDTSSPDAPVINTEATTTNQHRITISGTAQLGSEVTLSRDEDTFISVTTVEGNGDWSIENISLIENANTFTATATDVGGTSGNSNSVIIRLDTSSPDAPVINTEATTTNQHSITISGTAQSGSEVTLSRDEDTFISVTTVDSNGGWSIENIVLIENANTFTATATDVGGTSGNSNSVIIRLDTTVPIPPVINTEATTTNQNSITISGTAQLGSEVTLSRDEDTFISVTTVDSNGGWSIENIVLIENANTFTATATDVGGISGNSNSVIIRLDTSSPDAPVINTEAISTNQHRITISGTAQLGSEVTLSRDEDTFISVTTVEGNGDWSIENISLIENANTFTATATDVGGTSGNSNSVIIRLDTSSPDAPVINTEATTTNQHRITISGTAQLGSEVTLSRDEDTFISVTTVEGNGDWSIENISLIENANTFTATATDVGGTSGNSNSVIIRLDTTVPIPPVINTEAITTNQHSITISGTAQLGSEVTLSRDEDTFISVTTVNSNGGWSIENIVLIENANTFTATATDVGGTSGNSNSVIIRLDTSSPDAPVINTEATTTNQHSITISGTAQSGSEVTLSRDEDTFISVTTVDSNGGWSIENIVLIENANTFTATATDVGGTSGNSNSVIIRLDTTVPIPPVINTEATTTNQNSITISGTAQLGSEVTLSRDEDTFISVTTVDSNGGWSIENIVLIENANTFTATATDVGGISGNSNSVIIRLDTSSPDAPVINTEATTTNQNSITISGTAQLGSEVTLSRDEDTFISVTTVDSNGGWSIENIVLIENANTFTATATDVGGISGNSNSVIIRLDTSSPDAPVINTEAISTNQHSITISGTAQLGSKVTLSRDEDTFISVTTVDSNGGWSIENIVLIENANTFTATATDVGGISGNSNSVIIRLDTTVPIPPVINTEAITTNQHSITISGTAQLGSKVTLSRDEDTFISVTTVDSNGGWSIENIVLIENANTFTATATDVGGTSGNSNSVIIRLDDVAPTTTIRSTAPNPTNVSPIPFTVEFSKSVTGFKIEDIVVTGGTKSALSGSGTTYTFTVTPTGVGTIEINIAAGVVQDSAGNDNTVATAFSIGYINDVLTANAGDDQTVDEGETVTLDGSASSYPEGESLSYTWSHSNTDITLNDASAKNPEFTAPTQLVNNELFEFSLIVTDSRGKESSADSVTITVIAGANDAPTANAGDDQNVSEGATVTLDGSGSTDSEGEILTYVWSHSNVGITLSDTTSDSPIFTAPDNLAANVVLTFELIVTDARGLVSATDSVAITINVVENPVIMFTPNMAAISTDDGTVTGNILFKTYSLPENTQNVGEITVSTLEGGRTITGFEIATENSDKGFVHAGKLYELVGTGNTRTLQFKQDFVPDFENPINDNGIAEAGENQGCWLRLKVTDSGNTITQLDIRIEIKDVNEAARGVQMYIIGVSNNLPGGSIVGVLSAIDDATGNGDYTYTLVDAVDTANSADNNLFEIDGVALKFKASTSVSNRVEDYRISIQVAEAGFSKTAIEEFRITPYEKIFDISEQVFWFATDSYDTIPADDANVEEIVTRQDGSSRKTLVKLGDNDGDGNAKFKVNSFNFNPALEFENDEFVGSVGIRGSDARSYYVVASNSEATNNWRYVLGMGGASGDGFDIGKVGTFGSDNGKLILTYNGRDSDILITNRNPKNWV